MSNKISIKYNDRWTLEEERRLITTRIALHPEFSNKKASLCWEKVAMQAHLESKSLKIIMNKWQNIIKKYKKIINTAPGNIIDCEWECFNQIDYFVKSGQYTKNNERYISDDTSFSINSSVQETEDVYFINELPNTHESFRETKPSTSQLIWPAQMQQQNIVEDLIAADPFCEQDDLEFESDYYIGNILDIKNDIF